jgi:hypothetical protein
MPGACLYLTAWTAAVSWALVPVLVWIHARFGLGNSADIAYGGAALAGRGVVLVTINSRLGALDYLAPASLRAESDHGRRTITSRSIRSRRWHGYGQMSQTLVRIPTGSPSSASPLAPELSII